MLISRGWHVAKLTTQCSLKKTAARNLQQVQRSHGTFAYRAAKGASRLEIIVAEALGGIAWWWIFWHLWYDYKHITGEFDYPDPSKWTDAELGIPPDDED